MKAEDLEELKKLLGSNYGDYLKLAKIDPEEEEEKAQTSSPSKKEEN